MKKILVSLFAVLAMGIAANAANYSVDEAVKILVTLPKNTFGLTSDYSKEPAEDITFEFEVAE